MRFFGKSKAARFPGWRPSRAQKKPQGNKFGATPVTVNGVRYDSKAEAARALELKEMEAAGEIKELQEQPRFDLIINGVKVRRYKADFSYIDSDGRFRIEDVKGAVQREFKLMKRVFEAIHKDKGWTIDIIKIKDVSFIK